LIQYRFFSGEPCELNNFLNACEELIQSYFQSDEAIKKIIFRSILNKFRGKALTLISSRSELDNWQKIRDYLKISFSDQRSFTCLFQELHSFKPFPKENPYNFGVRLQYHRSLIFSSINNDSTLTNERKLVQIQNIEQLTLLTYLKYLPSSIQLGVRLKQPDNLEEAMTYVLEEENFISFTTEGRRNINQPLPTPTVKTPMTSRVLYNTTTDNRHQGISAYSSNQSPQFNYQRNPFPNRPIAFNNSQFPMRPNIFPPTNVQQIQTTPSSMNVWKPRGKPVLEKSTPMSGISHQGPSGFQRKALDKSTPMSGISHQGPSGFQRKAFIPQSRPTFYSEELHHTFNEDNNSHHPEMEKSTFETQQNTTEQSFLEEPQVDDNHVIMDDHRDNYYETANEEENVENFLFQASGETNT